MTARGGHRGAWSLALAAIAAALALGAVLTGYAKDALFDADEFADRAVAALDEPAVRDRIAAELTDDVIRAEPDLLAARPVIESAVSGIVGGGAFQSLFAAAVRDVHRAVLDQDRNTIVLTLADVGTVVRGALESFAPKLARKVPPLLDAGVLEGEAPGWAAAAARAADRVRALPGLLLLAAAFAVMLALALAPDRRRAVLRLGLAVAIAGGSGLLVYSVAHALVLGTAGAASERDAVDAVWGAFLGDLRGALLLFAAAGAISAAAASAVLRPLELRERARRAGELIATTPERPLARAARALVLAGAGVFLVLEPVLAIRLAVQLAGLGLACVAVAELIRLTAPGDEDAAARARDTRRTLVAGLFVAVAIATAGALFVGAGGLEETVDDPPRPSACNGDEQLCDLPLNEVAFPGTHNAMSGATYPGYLFAQQEAGIGRQLADGVRALLIDAHYGVPTAGGIVKTDLEALDGGEQAKLADEIGPEAAAAAMRIRDRIVDSPETGPRGVYLCHAFCELGAVPMAKGLGEIRDFVAASPGQVVFVVIEDYVAPEDVAAEFDRAGLSAYAYAGTLDPPPALGELADAGTPLVVLAEHDAGDGSIPWYRPAYEGLVQETPFSFKRPPLLADEANWPASCEPNRGEPASPYFLVNHWIDTSPAPRPSNAAIVNARRPLLGRVEHCERQRDLQAGIVAVDFYREGDLLEVVRELNAPSAGP